MLPSLSSRRRGGKAPRSVSFMEESHVAPPTQEFAAESRAPVSPAPWHEGAGELDDAYLVAQAKRGDSVAYDRLVRRYKGFVRLKASSYFLLGGESEDLIQEGLVGLYKAVRDFRSDRESSFRNFAELCITRQMITAVKTASRNKHAPLNQSISFATSPTAAGDGDSTLEEILPGPAVNDPASKVISTEELTQPGRVPDLGPLRPRERGAHLLPRWSLLRGDRRAARRATPRRSTTRCSGSSARSAPTSTDARCSTDQPDHRATCPQRVLPLLLGAFPALREPHLHPVEAGDGDRTRDLVITNHALYAS